LPPVILWFRQDLRLADNPALVAALATGQPILPLYINDTIHGGPWKMGAASRVWLHHSLTALNISLKNHLVITQGYPQDILESLIKETGATALYWNRCYEPWQIDRDKNIKSHFTAQGIKVESSNAALMYEPWNITKDDGTPYRVFTPYWRRGCVAKGPPAQPIPAPKNINLYRYSNASELDQLKLLPVQPRWDIPMMDMWTAGEVGATQRLEHFLDHGLNGYKEDRNRPDLDNVSRLSPHLHFGEISPRQVYHAAASRMVGLEKDTDHFMSELGWREFSHHLLFHNPTLPELPLQEKFSAFPWIDDAVALKSWQRGETGFPIVDAGMRQLWQTGWMHNRVRMIVGSFLVKNMLTHWRHGEDWFWDTLVDADLANNAASWQWIAGCGTDAAPYYRIFNPVLQGEKFDPHGHYVRKFVPEIAALPNEYLHQPWAAPESVLKDCGIKLGQTYPKPLMDHATARNRALAALARIKTTS
jgi:deoxyribodipyrimidine photo-lyase